MARITLKGFTVDYDGEEAIVSIGGKVAERFKTNAEKTALVAAQHWIKRQRPAPLETDKGVFDAEARDKFGNLLPFEPTAEESDDAAPESEAP